MGDHVKSFWDRMSDVQAGMLGLASDAKMVPMAPNLDDSPNEIWFISAQGTDLVAATGAGAQPARFIVAESDAGLYAQVEGMLSLSSDKAKLDEVWSSIAAAWFEEGQEDPDVRLLKFAPASAKVWTTSTSGLKFLYEIARANITDDKPDVGEHFDVTF